MRKWTRWQDWLALIAGVAALLAPLVTETDTTATWTMVILGGLTALAALYSLNSPGERDTLSEGSHAVLGVLLFISPWVMGFADLTGLAWTAWIAGVVTAVSGLLALPQISGRMHRPAASH